MIKAESKGERTLRSASPHRNAYKSDFHAIKCSFDGTKSDSEAKSYANGASDPREDSRGRPFGNRVNKIKNIFLQMDGQQPQESQDASPVSPVSPVSKFAVNANKPNSANSQEPQNTDRTPKAEEVEIDKVALAEKFSVTRKLFERGIKDQPITERPLPGRASTRLSHGKVPEEGGRGSRRSFGSSENINANSAIKTPPISPVRIVPEDKSIDDSKQVNRLSLNAGPISRRLENFIVDGENEESTQVINEKLSSPTRGSFQKSSSPGTDSKPTSPNADSSPKSFSPTSDPISNISPVSYKLSSSSSTGELISPSTNHSPFKRSPSSSFSDLAKPSTADESTKDPKSPTSPYKSSRSPEEPKSENHIVGSSSHEQCLDPAGAGVVRAELVVVQNESSESEDEDDEELLEDVMTEVKLQRELKSEAPTEDVTDSQNHTGGKFLENNVCLLDETKKGEAKLEEEAEEIVQKKRSSCHEDDDDDDDEESEQEDPDECGKTSPVFYSFENAAFVDDKEAEADKQEDEDEDEVCEEYDEVPGLSEEEERPSRRAIRFSTEPIRVSEGLFFLLTGL